MSNGKGSSKRPISVDQETFASNWERAFGTRVPPIETKKSIIEEQKFDYLTELHSGMFYEWYPGNYLVTGKKIKHDGFCIERFVEACKK